MVFVSCFVYAISINTSVRQYASFADVGSLRAQDVENFVRKCKAGYLAEKQEGDEGDEGKRGMEALKVTWREKYSAWDPMLDATKPLERGWSLWVEYEKPDSKQAKAAICALSGICRPLSGDGSAPVLMNILRPSNDNKSQDNVQWNTDFYKAILKNPTDDIFGRIPTE